MTDRTTLRRMRATLTALCLGALVLAAPARAQDFTFGIEINGTLCGYADTNVSTEQLGETEYTVVTERVLVMLTVLGNELNTEIDSTFHVDPTTGRFTRHRVHIRQGETDFEVRISVEGNTARIFDSLSGKEETIELADDVILENPARAPHLVQAFVDRGVETATWRIFEVREGEVQETKYTRVDRETLELAGRRFDTIVLERLNLVTGVKLRQWIDVDSGMVVKMDLPSNRTVYLADASVKDRIERADFDPSIVEKVEVAIADVHGIEFMKIRVILEPTGLRVRAEDLTVPGQRFEGTVTGNRIEGIFTIEHPHYDGASAPPFPTAFDDDEALAPFLLPEDMIESDDPVLVAHARAVTAGATDSWDAACRLSLWVADNIGYTIPGGIGAAQHLRHARRRVRRTLAAAVGAVPCVGHPRPGGLGLHVHAELRRRVRPTRLERDLHGRRGVGAGGLDRPRSRLRRLGTCPDRDLPVALDRDQHAGDGDPRAPRHGDHGERRGDDRPRGVRR